VQKERDASDERVESPAPEEQAAEGIQSLNRDLSKKEYKPQIVLPTDAKNPINQPEAAPLSQT
jgi:hypothetical protein